MFGWPMEEEAKLGNSELRGRYGLLAHREHEVLELVVTGLLNKQIADKSRTCETTVKMHRSHVMRKMRSGSLTDLVRTAERLGDV